MSGNSIDWSAVTQVILQFQKDVVALDSQELKRKTKQFTEWYLTKAYSRTPLNTTEIANWLLDGFVPMRSLIDFMVARRNILIKRSEAFYKVYNDYIIKLIGCRKTDYFWYLSALQSVKSQIFVIAKQKGSTYLKKYSNALEYFEFVCLEARKIALRYTSLRSDDNTSLDDLLYATKKFVSLRTDYHKENDLEQEKQKYHPAYIIRTPESNNIILVKSDTIENSVDDYRLVSSENKSICHHRYSFLTAEILSNHASFTGCLLGECEMH